MSKRLAIHKPNQHLQYKKKQYQRLQHGPSSVAVVALNQQKVVVEEEEEEDVSSGSSIGGCSSDLTSSSSSSSDNEDSSSASDDEVDSVKVDVSLKEACEDATGKLGLRYQNQLQNAFKKKKPTKDAWISTWKHATSPVWLNVYAYYDKEKGYGGYGVILRDVYLRPIIAQTSVTPPIPIPGEKSQLIQAFKGLSAGLALAAQLGPCPCPRLKVRCNVKKAVLVLSIAAFVDADDCVESTNNHEVVSGICKTCTKAAKFVDDDTTFDALIRLMRILKGSQDLLYGFQSIPRHQNEAAHCLAKYAKKKRNGCLAKDAKKKRKGCEDDSKQIKPAHFPPKLKHILFGDAYGLDTMYSHSLLDMMAV